jgi:phosphohistidine phosphatase
MSGGVTRLYFLRHGLADREAYTGTDDRLRPLTPAGMARMEAEAITLGRLDLKCDRILTSPLTRCRQTADIAATALGLGEALVEEEALACGFGLRDLPDLLAKHVDCRALMLVGHEPDFSGTVSGLTGGSDVVFKKGALARVDLHRPGKPAGELVWLIPPKLLALE